MIGNPNNNKKKKKSNRKKNKKPLAIKAYLVQLDESSGNQHNFSQQLIKSNFKNIPIQKDANYNNNYNPGLKWHLGTKSKSIQHQSVINTDEKEQGFSLYNHHRENLSHVNILEYDSGITLNASMLKQSDNYPQNKYHTNTNNITTSQLKKQNRTISKRKVKPIKNDNDTHTRTKTPLFWGNNYDINGDLIIGAIKSPNKHKIQSNAVVSSQPQQQHFYNLSISQSHAHHTPIDTVYSFLSDYNDLFNTDNLLNKTYLTAEQMDECIVTGSEDYDEFDLSLHTTSTPSTVANSPYLKNTKHTSTNQINQINQTNHRKATSSIQSFHQIHSLHQPQRTRSQFALLFSDNEDLGFDELDEEEGSVISSLSHLDRFPVAAVFDAYEGVKGIVLDMNMGKEIEIESEKDNDVNSKLAMEYTGSDTADTDTSIDDEEDTMNMGRTQEGEKASSPSSSSPSSSNIRLQSPPQSISCSSNNYHGFSHEFLVIIKNKSPQAISDHEHPEMSAINHGHHIPLPIPSNTELVDIHNTDSNDSNDSENIDIDITDDEYQEIFGHDQDGKPVLDAIKNPIFERCESAPIQLIQSHSTDAMNMNINDTHIPIYDADYQSSMTDEEDMDELIILDMDHMNHIENDSNVFDVSNLSLLPPNINESKSVRVSSKNKLKSMDIFDDVNEFIKECEDHERELRKERKRWRKREREKRRRSKLKRHSMRATPKEPEPYKLPSMAFAPKSYELPPKMKSPNIRASKSERKERDTDKQKECKTKRNQHEHENGAQPQLIAMDFTIKSTKSAEIAPKRKSRRIQASKSEHKERDKKKVKAKTTRKRKSKSKSRSKSKTRSKSKSKSRSKSKSKNSKPPKMKKAKTNHFVPQQEKKRKSKNMSKDKGKHKNKMKKSKSSQTAAVKKRKSAAIVEDHKKLKNRRARPKKSKSEKKRKISNPKQRETKNQKPNLQRAKTEKDKGKTPGGPRKSEPYKPSKKDKAKMKRRVRPRSKSKATRRKSKQKGLIRQASIIEPTPRKSHLEIQLEEKYFETGRQKYISTMINEMFASEDEHRSSTKGSLRKGSSSNGSYHCRTGPIYNGDDYLGEVFELDVDTILTHINMKSSLFSGSSPSGLCRQISSL